MPTDVYARPPTLAAIWRLQWHRCCMRSSPLHTPPRVAYPPHCGTGSCSQRVPEMCLFDSWLVHPFRSNRYQYPVPQCKCNALVADDGVRRLFVPLPFRNYLCSIFVHNFYRMCDIPCEYLCGQTVNSVLPSIRRGL